MTHLIPACTGHLLVQATLLLPAFILAEASLSFLGLGVQPPTPTWGVMLADGRVYLSTAWWLATFPGLAILVTVLSLPPRRRAPPPQPACDGACCLRPESAGSASRMASFGATSAFTFVTAR